MSLRHVGRASGGNRYDAYSIATGFTENLGGKFEPRTWASVGHMQGGFDESRETQLGAGHLAKGAVGVLLCEGRLRVKTNSFFELDSCPGGVV